ncbi:Ribosomal lysine N-methyltransferase 5 [Coniochaeta hoffmannii]|uniref:Ribosomal lysine N-methyltransferase 5 n=1 Tax=Coniochaeta hoffmannii TaxID=91930 RepID=A0AA38SC72_9PEZI|nr:Ribosomal lysine N-methyltransferase 5 [Coniochaeta hoffmannii]
MILEGLIQCLGDRVSSVEEETFDLFSQDIPSQNLGFIDPKSQTLEITVAGHDLTIHQSPAILSSNRSGGTTGAVVWKITPVFADWIGRPDNILFRNGILTPQSAVVELGCGISAVVGLLLAPKISSYVLTDQPYVSRLVAQNIEENRDALTRKHVGAGKGAKSSRSSRSSRRVRGGVSEASRTPPSSGGLSFRPLDWETDTVTSSLTGSETLRSFDAVLCCDCIYNEALVEPLVQTCADICSLRAGDGRDEEAVPCVCIVAQQLRDSDVFEAWLTRFARQFDVWRVPDSQLVRGLRSNSGFAVHIGVLKGCWESI